ncbi:MAG: NfeD family protein [Vibrio sp.]
MLLAYLPQILIALGILALILEITVFGFTTLLLFFLGIGFFITGISMQLGWQAVDLTHAVWSVALLTIAIAIVLWKPLRQIQNRTETPAGPSDFAQVSFQLTGDTTPHSDDVFHQYSGIRWYVRSQMPLSKGQWVKVVKTDVSVLWVEPLDDA